ncbi:Putative carboxypeptidase yodJ [Salisediminibacterium beveridgei]|uniref:Putative carboxypeptidase yodJ n=1 Tax=Salisediminibacterium beveridgei TaxID=632773 RepID=A0A1D7QZT8_9BACI|nr:Putative carboxypeptidase yodJ [Salisediminibacterium beveridgei]
MTLLSGCQDAREWQSGALAPERISAELSLRESVYFSDERLSQMQLTQTGGEDGTIQDPDHNHLLVNDDHVLDPAYVPEDLTVPDVRFSFSEALDRRLMREEAAEALERLFADAEGYGHELFAVSGYRSFERQEQLFTAYVNEHGEDEARKILAIPGGSEHQSGLAMDVSSRSNGFLLNTDFADTDEGKWLEEHAHEHGFIIRYPAGKEAITGISFEPWHIRYIGEDEAHELYQSGLTLEELIEKARNYQGSPD